MAKTEYEIWKEELSNGPAKWTKTDLLGAAAIVVGLLLFIVWLCS